MNANIEKMDKEDIVGYLIGGFIAPKIRGSEHKKQAVERYMRSYLRGLTKMELGYELEASDMGLGLSDPLQWKLDQAIAGYDKFMARRLYGSQRA